MTSTRKTKATTRKPNAGTRIEIWRMRGRHVVVEVSADGWLILSEHVFQESARRQAQIRKDEIAGI